MWSYKLIFSVAKYCLARAAELSADLMLWTDQPHMKAAVSAAATATYMEEQYLIMDQVLHMQIPSDNVPFNELPDMKAAEITAAGKEALLSKKFDMIRINYANPDMVRTPILICTRVDMTRVDMSLGSCFSHQHAPLRQRGRIIVCGRCHWWATPATWRQ